ncbi:MAG: formylglycine-generating enzyme family protein [Candidatus Electrothrix sp. EH2]|nr:formylglycine-generating enzyme family protein [Candidatus Electrothrix sp. EH2]
MSDGKRKLSFRETIPGIIAVRTTLLAGLATLITALYAVGIVSPEALKVSSLKAEIPAARAVHQADKADQPAGTTEPPSPARQGDVMIDSLTGMKLVYVPEGCFRMGSNEIGDDEKPVHKVCVDAFWMGKYEVTQGQWRNILRTNPAHFQKGNRYPMEQVSWWDVQKFIAELNNKTGKQYRLPTEAEWEYACRANSAGKYCGGYTADVLAWSWENSGKSTHSVGEKQANGFGLHDMSGNVWEWCADWYATDYYRTSPPDNPTGPSSGSYRVIRGGGWDCIPGFMRSAFRYGSLPEYRGSILGFRLVLPIQ